ncbi:MAG: peptide chain release factor N(5)-glutamine methyltransferase [Firmicutes bacterium]|nr:peptide chain release factor N(5)-glutamine methyltransferase [Bacillota bacterium]
MKISDCLKAQKEKLKNAGKEERDAEVVLSCLMQKSIGEVLAKKDDELNSKCEKQCQKIIDRRISKNEPICKIMGIKNFYGRDFMVNKHVLSPRQCTESLVEAVLIRIKERIKNVGAASPCSPGSHSDATPTTIKILDIGTGSGILAITLAKELETFKNIEVKMVATDISKKALKVAKKNAKLHGVNIDFRISDIFESINEKFDVIVSNPPYISEYEFDNELEPEVKNHDPKLALVGEESGYYFYERIINRSIHYLKPGGLLAFEVGHKQSGLVHAWMSQKNFKDVTIRKDYNAIERVVLGYHRD